MSRKTPFGAGYGSSSDTDEHLIGQEYHQDDIELWLETLPSFADDHQDMKMAMLLYTCESMDCVSQRTTPMTELQAYFF
jgi:hypothetical protein